MSRFEIHCPGCNVPLRVSSEWLGKKGRCRRCGAHVSHPPPGGDLVAGEVFDPSQTVLGWLGARRSRSPAAPRTWSRPSDPAKLVPARFSPQRAVTRSAGTFSVRLDQVDVSGAVFVFSSRLLYDEDFRAIFPQQCLVCGSRDLVVQRVIWGERFVPRVAPLPVPLKHLGDLRGRSLLAKLSPLHDVAEPYGLAMPFYLCGPCRVEAALEARATRPASAG